MFSKSVPYLIAGICCLVSAHSVAQDTKQLAAKAIEKVASENDNNLIKAVRPLPMTQGIMAIEDRNGNMLFSTYPNSRFTIKGVIYDNWTKKTITNVQDVHDAYTVPLSATGITPSELSTFTIGNTERPKSGVIFLDPVAKSTPIYLQQIMVEKENLHFDVVMMGTNAEGSILRLKTLWCAEDRNLAISSLIAGDNSVNGTKMKEDCAPEPMVKAAVAQQLLNIKGTPHTIRTDGLFYQGVPIDVSKWLAKEFKLMESK